jgi:predicted metal-dependent enzyme (double-stranded beta helix superfamily)
MMNTVGPIARVIARDPVPPALRRFIWDIQSMVELAESEREILLIGRDLMARLVTADDWLPAVFAAASPGVGRQFQIFRDGLERFSVVSTVLGGGASVTISQPAIWEIAGVLHGAVLRQQFDGSSSTCAQAGGSRLLKAHTIEPRSSGSGDVVKCRNAIDDQISIVVHVYGGDIARMTRRSNPGRGGMNAPSTGYANPESDPPYDIFSIQADIRD